MFFVGIDIGTTSTKAILFDKNGKVYGKSSKEYLLHSPTAAIKEQNPKEIFDAVVHVLKDIVLRAKELGSGIELISFSAMMHSIIALDRDGEPLTECIVWADSRSAEYAEKFKNSGKGIDIYRRTGTPCHPMSPLYKIMWIRDNRPEVFKNTHKFISIKEYVFKKFFDKYIVDYSIASATGMFNIYELDWDEEALELVGINKEQLSTPLPTTHYITGIKKEYAISMGLDVDVPFILGASDGCLANLGSNGINTGTAVVTVGTSGAIRVVSDEPLIDTEGRTFCYILTKDRYVAGGPINNGGIVYRWFRDNFAEKEVEFAKQTNTDPYDFINKIIENTNAGSDGLVFLPFLTGERAPYWNANLRGSFLGISDIHKKNHFARAIIEGVCYDLNDVYQVLRESITDVECIYANGGFTRSDVWVQVLCDVLDTKVIVSDNYESPCLGAVMIGMLALGMVNDLSECSHMLENGKEYNVSNNVNVYKKLFNIYKESINKVTDVLEQLAHYQKNI